MQHDVLSLWNFYYDSHLGKVTQRSLQRALREIWPMARGMNVAGYGFAAPCLRPFRAEAARTICLMPAAQGVAAWPREGPNATALVEEGHWPVTTGFIDRLIVMHAVETELHLDALMEEIWRILSPEGKVIIAAPNRSGVWARGETTPFGVGRPFSYGQLEDMLSRHKLEPVSRSAALYVPPSEKRFWLRTAATMERFGRRMELHRLAGVLLVEAQKRVYGLPNGGAKEHGGLLSPIRGLAEPAAAPVGNRSGFGQAGKTER